MYLEMDDHAGDYDSQYLLKRISAQVKLGMYELIVCKEITRNGTVSVWNSILMMPCIFA